MRGKNGRKIRLFRQAHIPLSIFCSTGGMLNKRYRRVGDSPPIGAGTYAKHVCAVSGTGHGEFSSGTPWPTTSPLRWSNGAWTWPRPRTTSSTTRWPRWRLEWRHHPGPARPRGHAPQRGGVILGPGPCRWSRGDQRVPHGGGVVGVVRSRGADGPGFYLLDIVVLLLREIYRGGSPAQSPSFSPTFTT